MSQAIVVGGISVIIAVMGILAFIFWEILPLGNKAEVTELKTIPVTGQQFEATILDEWSSLAGLLNKDGITFVHLKKEDKQQKEVFEKPDDGKISALFYSQENQVVVLGTDAGQFSLVTIKYTREASGRYLENGKDEMTTLYELSQTEYFDLSPGAQIKQIGYGSTDESKMVAAIVENDGKKGLHYVTLKQEVDLFGGEGELAVAEENELTTSLSAQPLKLLVSNQADSLVVATDKGSLEFFKLEDEEMTRFQNLKKPFGANAKSQEIASIDYVFGNATIVVNNTAGEMFGYSLYFHKEEKQRLWGLTKKELPSLAKQNTFFTRSMRNKSFLVGQNNEVKLCFATTEAVNWEGTLDYNVKSALISEKYNRILIVDTESTLHLLKLNDPHPESSMKTFFGKIWYEGQSEPKYLWESSGATDEAEPKLSMWPLIFGSLKATFYALFFAVPLAILAAIYVSQFMHPSVKAVVKPVMEIMASLPSVVIGFLGALWLAPRIEDKFPSLLLAAIVVPLTAVVIGVIWSNLPVRHRSLCKPGNEFLFFIPAMLLMIVIAWQLGPVFEKVCFSYTDTSGAVISDFRQWWTHVTGLSYEQKNSLVVGFAMGFAVIPIVFTISEDALSNVPKNLTSASLALGANRWQTTQKVVLPTASAGIFSAVMIGLGRAVGETMIVLFGAGGVALMDPNIFNGMRTLSVNLATELPEAPVDGTLYRALFMGAFLLFIMTFVINTFAEVLRQYIRDKYKTV